MNETALAASSTRMGRDGLPLAGDAAAADRVSRLLANEPVVWLSTVRPNGSPHVVPIWFSWDGETLLIASKPRAVKVANLRANPQVMLALGDAEEDFDVGLLEGVAEILDEPAAAVLPSDHLRKYRDELAVIGLDDAEYLATYSVVIRVRPTRFLPWHGRSEPASAAPGWTRADRRLHAAVRRVAASVGGRATHRGAPDDDGSHGDAERPTAPGAGRRRLGTVSAGA